MAHSEQHFPRDPDDLTPEWLTAKLTATGVLTDGVEVESLTWEPIGNGFAGVMVRVEPSYRDDDGRSPTSIAAKFRAHSESTQEFAQSLRAYEREVHFYEEVIGPDPAGSGIATPAYYGSEFDAVDGSFVLLLEDLRDAEPGDHIAGCSPERAESVIRAYARMHTRWYEDPIVEAELYALDAALVRDRWETFRQAVPVAVGSLDEWLSADLREVLAALIEVYPALLRHSRLGAGRTLIHGDAHVANVLFRADDAPVIIDWQLVSSGIGTEDIAGFMLVSMSVEDRRASQDRLLSVHATGLADGGIDRTFSAIETEVAALTLLHVAHAAIAIANVDFSTEQGQETLSAIVPRLNAAAEDFGDVAAIVGSILA